jgi:SagB-type dehydrogenase family enzyme
MQSTWGADLLDKRTSDELSVSDILTAESAPEAHISSFEQLCAILNLGLKFNIMPTGGVLVPLEIFGLTTGLSDMPSGVFHVDKEQARIHVVQPMSDFDTLAECFPHDHLAGTYIFITALFQRSAMVFGEKGYRYAVTESGRLGQNLMIVAASQGFRAVFETQYYDREIERLIGVDGVEHALLQVIGM